MKTKQRGGETSKRNAYRMKIKRINIKGYRVVDEAKVDFGRQINVLYGVNGAGKSTVLEALEKLLSWFVARLQTKTGKGKHILQSDITKGEQQCWLQLELDGGQKWSLFKQDEQLRDEQLGKSDLTEMNLLVNQFFSSTSQQAKIDTFLPIVCYGVDRAVAASPTRIKAQHMLNPIDVYCGWNDEKADFKVFFEWFREREDLENELFRQDKEHFKPDYQLQAVRQALETALPGYDNLRINRRPTQVVVMNKGDEAFRFDELSDGEKCYITLISDLARRLAMVTSPQKDPLKTAAIALIDEVDLHLHPAWQQDVIDNLTRTFPNVQFFITTHSPFVVSSVKTNDDRKIFVVDNGKIEELNDELYGATVDHVLLRAFDLKTLRNKEVQKRIDEVWRALANNKQVSEDNNEAFAWLKANLSADDVEFARIALEMARIKKKEGK